jgi:peptide/nickel transport system permease protein
VLRRVGVALALAIAVSFLVYGATTVLPGDVAAAVLGRNATPEAVAALRVQLGLNDPFLTRYAEWLGSLAHGDFGSSLAGTRMPVWDLIATPLRNTAILAAVTLVVLVPLSVVIGIASGLWQGRTFDRAATGVSLTLTAVPEFVVGALLVLAFAVYLPVLPAVSLIGADANPLAVPEFLALPIATLVIAGAAYLIRIVRISTIETVATDYVEAARLIGVPERQVVVRYVVRNSLAPTIQAIAATAQWLLGGIFVIEVLFAFPGIGNALVTSVQVRDVPVIQAIAMLLALAFILINLVADIVTILVDPRLRTAA